MSLVIKNLVKIYGEQRAVDNISFNAKKGEILGFLGPNGAGKSTTMKIATCFLEPTEGQVLVCGEDVVSNPLKVKSKIGYLAENNPLYTEMYVREYLEFVGKVYGLKGNTLQKAVAQMIDNVGLGSQKTKKIGELSKGYRQRTGLAAAMIHDPEVLILDEPTTGLDPNQVVEIRNLIRTVSADKTVLFSTHIMQEVQQLCDRVVIINSGKIVADDQVSLLSQNALVKNSFKLVVSFSSAIDQSEFDVLEGLDSVKKISDTTFELISTQKNIRASLLKLISSKNWDLLEMKMEEISLEKIFHELTKKD